MALILCLGSLTPFLTPEGAHVHSCDQGTWSGLQWSPLGGGSAADLFAFTFGTYSAANGYG